MARKSFLAILVGVAALAVPSAFADQGGSPHEGSNGQGRPADQTQTQAQTHTSGKALAKGHAKTHAKAQAKAKGHAKVHTNAKAKAKGQAKVHANGKALAKGHAKTQAPKVNTHAKAGKTTICHATGSATNPYVTITISNNALPAHRRHQDGRDIIPAPVTGCPTAATAQEQQGSTQGTSGSSTQGTAGANAQGTAGTGSTPGASTNGSGKSPNQVSVLGASTSGSAPSASNSPSATGTQASSSNGLPFTGTDAIIVAILGLAALLLGVTARRATTNRAS